MSDNTVPALVIDCGSSSIKAGFAGDEEPKVVFRTLLGQPKLLLKAQGDSTFIGEDAMARKDILSLRYPIQRGFVTDWDDMEKLFFHLFYDQMKVAPEEHAVLLTEALLNPRGNREKMAEIMFEIGNVPGLYMETQGVLSLYGSGRTVGLVLESGEGVTQIVPVDEDHPLPQAIERVDLAGRDVTDYLSRRMLVEQGINFTGASQMERLRDIKEKLCYVARDFEEENPNRGNTQNIIKTYELPDGQEVEVCDERFWAPEILFKPELDGRTEEGIHQKVFSSIMKCDADFRKYLCRNVVLSGGTTMCPGIAERLDKELRQLLPSDMNSRVIAASDREYMAWIGGSILASLSSFQDKFFTKQEYDEKGPSLVHTRSPL